MAVGLLGRWKIPLGYFLTNGLQAEIVANIVKEALVRLHSVSVVAVAVTFDGAQNQIAAMELLGANFSHLCSRPYFPHPADSTLIVMAILDVSHMLKLIRNSLHSCGTFIWNGRGTVRWEYFERLETLQSSHQLRGGNKLTRQHVDFANKKMRVYLASQLFSKSVADTLRFCHACKVSGFSDSDVLVTADFCQLVNDLFDIMNSRSLFGKDFHAPITAVNFEEKKIFFAIDAECSHFSFFRFWWPLVKFNSFSKKNRFCWIFLKL